MSAAPTPATETPAETMDLGALAAFAARLAGKARAGDVFALWGDLGAGKTTFARAFITARMQSAGALVDEVPSPTFTLVQTYQIPGEIPGEPPGDTIWHFDLYRLSHAAEVWELGVEEALADGISLIEWPERMGPLLPTPRIDVVLDFVDAPDLRQVTVRQVDG